MAISFGVGMMMGAAWGGGWAGGCGWGGNNEININNNNNFNRNSNIEQWQPQQHWKREPPIANNQVAAAEAGRRQLEAQSATSRRRPVMGTDGTANKFGGTARGTRFPIARRVPDNSWPTGRKSANAIVPEEMGEQSCQRAGCSNRAGGAGQLQQGVWEAGTIG
jgi:hypothetical protein